MTTNSNKGEGCLVVIGLILLLLVVSVITGWKWYTAGVQVEVYRRSGIEMSQWEVFIGAKPPERTLHIDMKEKP